MEIPDIIPESLPECLIIVVIGRADTRYHDGLSVSSQRRLQQTCQFRVPVWNVSGAAVHQRCGNDVMIVKVKGLTFICITYYSMCCVYMLHACSGCCMCAACA